MLEKNNYKLVLRSDAQDITAIKIGNIDITSDLLVIAGPCSVEDKESMFRIADALSNIGIKFLRAGAYKPRNSPYAFQGLGSEGVAILAEVKKRFDLKIVSEAIDVNVIDEMVDVVDILQVGSRNMHNSSLLKKLGAVKNPILLKRGMVATLDEFLYAAEYVMHAGNPNVILCERGLRSFTQHCRNQLDIAAIPYLRQVTHLPIIVDPSHAAGRRDLVVPLAKAAVAAGAQGLMIEAHTNPDDAYSDAAQTIDISTLSNLLDNIQRLYALVNNHL